MFVLYYQNLVQEASLKEKREILSDIAVFIAMFSSTSDFIYCMLNVLSIHTFIHSIIHSFIHSFNRSFICDALTGNKGLITPLNHKQFFIDYF